MSAKSVKIARHLVSMLSAAVFLLLLAPSDLANGSIRDVEATQIGAYQAVSAHFVRFSALSSECKISPTIHVDEAKLGGKALVATLITALLNKRKVCCQAACCEMA